MIGQILDGQILREILIDIGKNSINLIMVGSCKLMFHQIMIALLEKDLVQEGHQFQEDRLIQDILTESFVIGQLMDVVEEPLLFFCRQRQFMTKIHVTASEAVIKIRLFGTELFQVIRIDGQDNPFMFSMVNLSKVMAFILIDKEDISGIKVIKSVVY